MNSISFINNERRHAAVAQTRRRCRFDSRCRAVARSYLVGYAAFGIEGNGTVPIVSAEGGWGRMVALPILGVVPFSGIAVGGEVQIPFIDHGVCQPLRLTGVAGVAMGLFAGVR